ncbi:ABC transporter permease [Chitinophagaceae bacterium 26-R-25]|nr:ABC transporter permease [Chitinophagaceae bacterium 26-R-25]
MRRVFEIIGSSFKMAIDEFRANKLRTFLSLFGITIGIFCIIGVLATVNSLERNVQTDIKSLGSNSIYVQKTDFSQQNPWWKTMGYPNVTYAEMEQLKRKVPTIKNVTFLLQSNDKIDYESESLSGVNYYGITEEFSNIQNIEIVSGRYLQQSDFDRGSNSIVMGNDVAEQLFGSAERAVGKEIEMKGKKGFVVGLIKKQGKSMIGGWDFDNSMIMPYQFLRGLLNERSVEPTIIVQGQEKVPVPEMRDELTGAMRSIRRLKPTESNNFTLNDIDSFSNFAAGIFSGINQGGWAIAALSLVVGMFGVANIMFVTVRERTSQIGLKKAIGAKRGVILMEFLMESAFLCILGGLIGLALVFLLTKVFSSMLGFPIYISLGILSLAIGICILVGVLAGIIPATIAAKMNPVVAIRSK